MILQWQKRREEEAARLAAMRNSGGGEEGDSDAADKKRMKVLARVNPAYASALAKEQSTRAAIAKVTAQEQKAWTRENTLKVEATQEYKDSDNKGQYLKQELQNIRNDEAVYRAVQKAEEQAKIAAQNREEKLENLFAAEAEMDAVNPVTPYVVSSYLDKEEETWLKENESQRAWTAVEAQESEKEKPWWSWNTIQENFRDTMTSREDWMNRAIGALPKVKDTILLAPITIKKTLNKNGNYLFQINKKMVETVSTINNGIVSRIPKWASNIFDVNTTPIPSTKNGYKKWITEQLGLNIQREAGTSIQTAEVMDRIKDYFSREWTDIKDGFKSLFTKQVAKETAEEAAEVAVEVAAKQAAESATKANLKAVLPSFGDALVETGFNIYDYTLGDKKDEPDKLQKILVGSGVDIGGAALTGAAAAGTVALIVAAVAYFMGAPVTVPLTVLAVMTIVVGFFFDIALETSGVKKVVKDGINNYIDHLQSLPPQPAAKMPYEYEASTYFPPSVQASPPVAPIQNPPASPSQTPEP